MSLINQLLQDLEKRRASGAETRSLSPRVRALPRRVRSGALVAVGLLGVAVAAAIGVFVYSEHWKQPAPISTVAPPAPRPTPARVAAPVAAAPVEEALVRDALTVPVFQLAEELRHAPVSTPAQPSAARQKAASSRAGAPRKPAIAAAPAKPRARAPSPTQAAASAATSRSPAVAPDVEEVVIPDTPAPVPVEKQMREPTAFERAELEFRNAVTRLRQGRVADAEAGFRAALKEDRSHGAARQALLGLLIDSGRNRDAEEVLRETLSVNPRQPRHAMLLARLELERGDAAAAVKTLEAARQYAGVDAEYFAFLAAVYQRLGRHQQAAELYANALTVTPGNAVWMMGLGISLQALQRVDEARTAFRAAAESRKLNADLQAFVESRLRELSVPKR